MVVIFGWGGGEAKDLGEIAPTTCPNCHNQVFLHHIRSQKHVSLYFVPMANYGTNEYLACPICRHGIHIGPQHHAALASMRGDGVIPPRRARRGCLPRHGRAVLGGAWRGACGRARPEGGRDDPATSHGAARAVARRAARRPREAPCGRRPHRRRVRQREAPPAGWLTRVCGGAGSSEVDDDTVTGWRCHEPASR